jgi:hypothetical protein
MARFHFVKLPTMVGAMAFLVFFLSASVSHAVQTCTTNYCVGFCSRSCSDPDLGGATTKCEDWLIENNIAGDTDGVPSPNDNCVCTNNTNQADCDNDGKGNVCDTVNGTFVAVDRWYACASDYDIHAGYYDMEVQEHRQFEDISACNSADRWDRRTRTQHCPIVIDSGDCCEAACSNPADTGVCHPLGQYFCNPDTMP